MSECTNDCSSCSSDCSSRTQPQSFLERPHELSNIKRVIGVGGDTVKIKNSKVYVNDEELNEPYIHDEITEGDVDTIVPEGSVFVLGDNREISLDSRYDNVGFINESDILGKVFVRLYPFNRISLLE